MSLWWIGVKSNGKMKAFQATKAEAFSDEFEQVYGIAFGSFRSKIQAESEIKARTTYLVEEADKERIKRSESGQIGIKLLKTKKDAQNHAEKVSELAQQAMKTSKPAELSKIPQRLQTISLVFEELNGLKLQIVRAIEALKLLKQELEADDTSNG